MKSVKKPVKYKSLSIPEPLFNELKKIVQKNSNYRSMAEFLREAIREKMRLTKTSNIKKDTLTEINNIIYHPLKRQMLLQRLHEEKLL